MCRGLRLGINKSIFPSLSNEFKMNLISGEYVTADILVKRGPESKVKLLYSTSLLVESLSKRMKDAHK